MRRANEASSRWIVMQLSREAREGNELGQCFGCGLNGTSALAFPQTLEHIKLHNFMFIIYTPYHFTVHLSKRDGLLCL